MKEKTKSNQLLIQDLPLFFASLVGIAPENGAQNTGTSVGAAYSRWHA
jgi:hypothetical protein